MSVEAQRCTINNCKGFLVFDNSDFDHRKVMEINGYYSYGEVMCTECNESHLIVPHYAVINVKDFSKAEEACITDYEKSRIEGK